MRILRDIVIAKRLTGHTYEGSIAIPVGANFDEDENGFAQVLQCGPGYRRKDGSVLPLKVRPGDKIIFGKFHHERVKWENDQIVLLEKDILAIVED